ncbi:MAG: hypothetical protein ACK57W_11175 [Flavobacteriales bacterium]
MAPISSKSRSEVHKRRLWIIAFAPWVLGLLLFSAALFSGLPDIETLANPKINLATEVLSSDGQLLGA